MMRILMLGNSYTFFNDMPQMLAAMTGAEVVANTRGGARLSEQLDPQDPLGAEASALLTQHWDYVVLQEYSNGPITFRDSFLQSVSLLCEKARAAGAKPLLYATWPYQPTCEKLAEAGVGCEEMAALLYDAYHEAASRNDALIADVGQKFCALAAEKDLYIEDGSHPTELGSRIAAETIADVIRKDVNAR